MAKFRGLVYVKHGRVGTRSEGPDYYLQTYRGDYLLRYQERMPWRPDYQLEFYGRRMVEVTGSLIDRQTIKVESIAEILSPGIPRPGQVEPHLGEPFEVKFGQTVRLADAQLSVQFLAVEQESRCPVGVICVWEGQCVVTLALTKGGVDAQKLSLTARAGHPDLAATECEGYRIELHAVEPAPTKDEPQPRHEQYRVSLEINAIA